LLPIISLLLIFNRQCHKNENIQLLILLSIPSKFIILDKFDNRTIFEDSNTTIDDLWFTLIDILLCFMSIYNRYDL